MWLFILVCQWLFSIVFGQCGNPSQNFCGSYGVGFSAGSSGQCKTCKKGYGKCQKMMGQYLRNSCAVSHFYLYPIINSKTQILRS